MRTVVLDNKTPSKVLHRVKPAYAHLKAFGCLCYASTLKRNRNKFQPRAQPRVFVGYPYGQKAYKFLNLEAKKIFTSRDVKFHEALLPYHYIQQ